MPTLLHRTLLHPGTIQPFCNLPFCIQEPSNPSATNPSASKNHPTLPQPTLLHPRIDLVESCALTSACTCTPCGGLCTNSTLVQYCHPADDDPDDIQRVPDNDITVLIAENKNTTVTRPEGAWFHPRWGVGFALSSLDQFLAAST
jgi:hypothetical protein